MSLDPPCLKELHKKIQSSSPEPQEHDFIIWTDGSGYDFGYSGSSSIILNVSSGKKDFRLNAAYAQTTHRAEFEGLLSGLQCVLEIGGWEKYGAKQKLDQLPQKVKPKVLWYGDNESLILAVYRTETGEPYYRRKTSADLWARFEYYERALQISPFYIPRNSLPEHALADRLAGESRQVLKDYVEILLEDQVV